MQAGNYTVGGGTVDLGEVICECFQFSQKFHLAVSGQQVRVSRRGTVVTCENMMVTAAGYDGATDSKRGTMVAMGLMGP